MKYPAEQRPASKTHKPQQASARIVVLVLICFLLGAAAAALWLNRSSRRSAGGAGQVRGSQDVVLSDTTRAVLSGLTAPVEIRYYSLLDRHTLPESLIAFAQRVNSLLSEFEREANGKIKVTRYDSISDDNAQAAIGDGIQPFNREKGDLSFLGIAMAQNQQKETLARLDPTFEGALEFDIVRAIVRITATAPVASQSIATGQPDAETIEEVKRILPDYASLTVAEGNRILTEAALKEYTAAAKEMEAEVKDAEQRFSATQSGQSEANQAAALKHLQDVQATRSAKLQAIAAQLQNRIASFQQLKREPQER